MTEERDPCIMYRAPPMNRMDLLPAPRVNTSGIYSKPLRKARIPTRPAQVGLMIEDIKTRTGMDITEAYVTQYKQLPPTEPDLVNFNPYYSEAPIIGSGGLVNRPTLSQQTHLNIINQLNLAPPIVGSGSALTLISDLVQATPSVTLEQRNALPSPLSGYQTPSQGERTPPEISQEESRQEGLEDLRQASLGNVRPPPAGFGKLPPKGVFNRPAPLNPEEPSTSKPTGSNIMSALAKPFSRFTRARVDPLPPQEEMGSASRMY